MQTISLINEPFDFKVAGRSGGRHCFGAGENTFFIEDIVAG